jgi:hypothetical protein
VEITNDQDAIIIRLDYDEAMMLNTCLDLTGLDRDSRKEEALFAEHFAALLRLARRKFWRSKSWRP